MYRLRVLAVLVSVVLVLCFPKGAVGQGTEGSILGRVTDPGGAVVPEAAVIIQSEQTGIKRNGTTNREGLYTVSNLPPGRYIMTVTKEGFKQAVLSGIILQVAQEARVDVSLNLGALVESIEVEASTPLVETESAVVGAVVDNNAILRLPLNGRNFMELATLTGGVNEGAASNAKNIGGKQASPSSFGQSQQENSYKLDGVDHTNQIYGGYSIDVSVDAVQEFRIQAGQYSAAYGGGGGAVINVVTKSGSNQFHGAAYEFLRNDVLDARNFFAAAPQPLRRNQFGVAAGGPIIRNRTFLFGSYEGTRERSASSRTARVPTEAERLGDLSGLGKQVLDPATGLAFPNATIPVERWDSVSQNILEFFPLPNSSDPLRNFTSSLSRKADQDLFLTRFDHQISDRNNLMFRYAHQDSEEFSPGTYPLVGGRLTPQAFHNAAVTLTSTLRPTIVNDLRIGYNRVYVRQGYQNTGQQIGERLGLPFASDSEGDRFPSVTLSRTAITPNLSEGNVRVQQISSMEFGDHIKWSTGAHFVSVGFEVNRLYDGAQLTGTSLNGSYAFNGQFTGDGFADFLLGHPATAQVAFNERPTAHFTRTRWAGYLQDDWKVLPRLTLNLGIRYDFETFPRDDEGNESGFDVDLGGVRYVSHNTNAAAFYRDVRPDLPFGYFDSETPARADKNNIAPRFGFAYRPLSTTRTVIRGGYGWFYTTPDIINNVNQTTGTAPTFLQTQFTSDINRPTIGYGGDPTLTPATLFQGVAFSASRYGPQFLNGYNQEWSLSLSQELTRDLVIEAQYLGAKSTHLPQAVVDINVTDAAPGPLVDRVPFPKWTSILGGGYGANANYNGLVISAERRFSKGFAFRSAYTWGKALTSRGGRTQGSNLSLIQDGRNLVNEVAETSDDVRHRFTTNFVLDLPFGKGKAFGDQATGLAGKLIGGWQVNGILTYRTGFPVGGAPVIAIANCNAGFLVRCRPDLIGDPLLGGNGVDSPRFDISAFDWPRNPAHEIQAPRFGSARTNILRGNDLYRWDLGVVKHTSLSEAVNLQFRFEMFNAFNHANFGDPNDSVESSAFGRTFEALDARELQFGLKVIW